MVGMVMVIFMKLLVNSSCFSFPIASGLNYEVFVVNEDNSVSLFQKL